ncbi:MAG TPA: hypothetical protein VF846_21030 [Thermoanaerobaculia bacterium]|jgi:hypothetical protein
MRIYQSEDHAFDANVASFVNNRDLPRHRWYEFKEGFSEGLVAAAIETLAGGRRPPRLLDPFVGSGTTLVTGGKMGLAGTGIEVNPFLRFAASAKCSARMTDRQMLSARIRALAHRALIERPSPVEGLSTFTERHGLDKWLFNRSVLRGFEAIDSGLDLAVASDRALRLALFAALQDCSNAKRDGKCLRYRDGWREQGYTSRELREAFVTRATVVADDLCSVPFKGRGLKIIPGDARTALTSLPKNEFDLIVTSPPYLNSFDYSDVYRPEMFVGKFVETNSQLRDVRLQTIRSHVQVKWTAADGVPRNALVAGVLKELEGRPMWNRRIPAMIHSYFVDMQLVLRELHRVARRGAVAWFVVSTSAYAGVHVPVDFVLAEIAAEAGWKVRELYVLRELRASGQHFKRYLAVGARPPLRESLLVFERK